MENALADIENASATIVSNIIKTGTLPKPRSEEGAILLAFVVILHSRTLYAAEATNEMFDKLQKATLRHNPRFAPHLADVEFRVNNPIALPLLGMSMYLPIVLDLESRLLVNASALDFLSSDNPVVFYNQFLETRKTVGSITGLALKGLQILLPISPRYLLLYFDPGVYRVRGWRDGRIKILDRNHVDSLNHLQSLSADDCLYYSNASDADYVSDLFERASNQRRTVRANVREYEEAGSSPESGSSIIHTYGSDISSGLQLSFVEQYPDVQGFAYSTQSDLFRDPELVQVLTLFREAVMAGKYSASEYFQFLDDFGNNRER